MRFWRSDDQRIQWLAAKFGNYLVDANARFAASSKWRSVMSISTLVNAIDNLAKEKSPNMSHKLGSAGSFAPGAVSALRIRGGFSPLEAQVGSFD
jgi:hypothetical protein